MVDGFEQYYLRQASGAGIPVFRGIHIQRGSGIGNVLNAAFRMLIPSFKAAGKAVLREGVSTGANILSDVISGQSLKSSAKRRAVQGGQNLMERALERAGFAGPPPAKKGRKPKTKKTRRKTGRSQSGSGRRRSKAGRGKKRQSRTKTKGRRRTRRSQSVVDIFSA